MKFMPYLVILAAVAAVGCSTSRGKFTRQNYEALYYTQPASEVEKILGKPAAIHAIQPDPEQRPRIENWEYKHKKPFYEAVITLQDGRVLKTEWWDDPSGPTSAPASGKGVGPKTKPKNEQRKNPT